MTIPKKIANKIRGRPDLNSCQLIVTSPSEYIVFTINLSRLKIITNPQNNPNRIDTITLSNTVDIA